MKQLKDFDNRPPLETYSLPIGSKRPFDIFMNLDHPEERPRGRTPRKDSEKRLRGKTPRKDSEKRPQEKTPRKDPEKRPREKTPRKDP